MYATLLSMHASDATVSETLYKPKQNICTEVNTLNQSQFFPQTIVCLSL